LDDKDPNSDPQTPDLGDSIDALLGDIDATCASYSGEDPPAEKDEPVAVPDDSAVQAGDEAVAEPVEDAVEDSIPEDPEDEVGGEALEALEAVSQNAESLLEDTIGELLDEEGVVDVDSVEVPVKPDGPGNEHVEADAAGEVEDKVEGVEEPEAVQAVETDLLDEIHEALDELDDAAHALDESPVDGTVPGEAQTDDDEGLLDSVNEDLVAELESVEIEQDASTQVDVQEVDEGAQSGEDTPVDLTEEVDAAVGELVGEDELVNPMLEDLDSALANIGDDLLDGDFETADGELVESSDIEEAIDPAMLLDQLDIPDLLPDVLPKAGGEDKPTNEPAPQAPTTGSTGTSETDGGGSEAAKKDEDSVESVDRGVTVAATVPVEAVVPEAIRSEAGLADETAASVLGDGEIESIWQTLLRVGKARGGVLLERARIQGGPIAARGILALSKPVASKPAKLRDSIGYLAIWTLFLACVLWFYVVFFRTTPMPVPAQAPTRVVTPGEDLSPIEHQMDADTP
jgi:hypothetical protein